MTDGRHRFLKEIDGWHYRSFSHDGAPIEAVVTEMIGEQELPKTLAATPTVSLERVHFGLRRTGCYGSCPSYSMDIYGDGHAVYKGSEFVDVVGEHTFSVPSERVAKLVAMVRTDNLWSLRKEYGPASPTIRPMKSRWSLATTDILLRTTLGVLSACQLWSLHLKMPLTRLQAAQTG